MDSQERAALMEQWYRQYAPLLFHYACQLTDRPSAEEAVQETFLIAWEAVQHQDIQHPKTWLRKITENVLRNQLRRQSRQAGLLVSAEELPEAALGRGRMYPAALQDHTTNPLLSQYPSQGKAKAHKLGGDSGGEDRLC